MVNTDLPSRARVVVIGGGVIGTSVAYHLAHLGLDDVVLLERDRLTSGTTWHAAGPDGHLRVDVGDLDRDAQVHPRPVRPAGGRDRASPPGSSRSGSSRWPTDAGPAGGVPAGVRVQPASAASTCRRSRRGEVGELFPLARTDDMLAGFYVAEDGRANPVDVTMALAKGARHARRDGSSRASPVTGRPDRTAARSPACAPPHGDIEAEYVVNCAGMWARQLGERGRREHPAAGRRALLPDHRADRRRRRRTCRCSRTRPRYGYFREEGGGLMLGLFEAVVRAVERRPDPGRLLVRRAAAGLGPDGALPGEGDGPRADHRRTSASARSSAARRASRPTCRRSSARRPSCATTSSPPG